MSLTLEHRYRPGKDQTNPSPAIIMLHGYGSDENDLFSFSEAIPEEYAVVSLRAPLSLQPFGYAWYTIYFDQPGGKFSDDAEAIRSREIISENIDKAIELYDLDPTRITLMGFSQGAILSLAVALSHPKKVIQVAALSGYVNPDILTANFEKNDFSGLRVFASHGSVDQVIPVSWGQRTPGFLDSLGIKNEFYEYPVGHGVAPQNFYDLLDWLEAGN
jgi:phospholipase/carboxylesterase